MGKIILECLKAEKNRVEFHFSVTEDVEAFLARRDFFLEYSDSVETVPKSILTVPFVANFLPIAWVLNAEIQIDELDEDFFHCISGVEAGYHFVYPQWKMGGKVTPQRLVKNEWQGNKTAMLYSGGLDAACTLFDHIEEKPDLFSVWGSDIRLGKEDKGWQFLHQRIQDTASHFNLNSITVRTDFREVEREDLLNVYVGPLLEGDGWWHGIKHSLPLLSFAMPIASLRGYRRLYIASSYWGKAPLVTCASNPWSDNQFRTGACSVVHDGFDYSRQEKARHFIEGCEKHHFNMPIHVCWTNQTGKNCCRCEKCYRTLTELLAEGADPEKFGFEGFRREYTKAKVSKKLRRFFYAANKNGGRKDLEQFWNASKDRISERRPELEQSEFWPVFHWLLTHDLSDPKDITLPWEYRIKAFLKRLRSCFHG